MAKIVSVYTDLTQLDNKLIDALLIPVKDLSSRSKYELSLLEIDNIKTKKEVYLLCDRLFSEEEINLLEDMYLSLLKFKKIFFQDLSFIELAKKYGGLDKLVYYSPTLTVNYQDIEVMQSLKINNFVLSKECAYEDYLEILNNSQANISLLAFSYPQLYFSKRKMITSFNQEYQLNLPKELLLKERTRDFYQPIYESNLGTFIFASEIFFPYKHLHEFNLLGVDMFIIDPSFINLKEDIYSLVDLALKGELDNCDFAHDYLMNKMMVNEYEK